MHYHPRFHAGPRTGESMIRATLPQDTPLLVSLAEETGVFKPMEVIALREVLDDYHAGKAGPDHVCVTCEEGGPPLGFAYFAPVEMTERTWCLWWIAVGRAVQSRGIGGRLLSHVEEQVRRAAGRLL